MSNRDLTLILGRKLGTDKPYIKEFLAEFLGTFILILFGDGAVAQMVFLGDTNDFFSIIWGYSLAVVFGILVSGGISGGHINPAVTLAMAVWGRFPWSKVPIYMFGQYLGSFVASLVLYYEYSDALHNFEGNRSLATAGIWATYPGKIQDENGNILEYLTCANGFGDQVLLTGFLLIVVCAMSDKKNVNIPDWMSPFIVGFAVMNIGLSFGALDGFAINPARDFSPRFFTFLAGWGNAPFTATTVDEIAWWWVPIVAPHLGAILGIVIYSLFIEIHHQEETKQLEGKPSETPALVKSEC